MLSRTSPLSRSALVELEELFSLFQRHHYGSPLVSSPVTGSAFAEGVFPPATPSPAPQSSSSLIFLHADPGEHPISLGLFFDVFTDPYTKGLWRLEEKLLYIAWWSFRPTCCWQCGTRDVWFPSASSEFKCGQCGAAAGSTRTMRVVVDSKAQTFNGGGGGDRAAQWAHAGGGGEDSQSSEESSDDGEGAGQEGGGAGEGSRSVVGVYVLLYQWWHRIPSPVKGTQPFCGTVSRVSLQTTLDSSPASPLSPGASTSASPAPSATAEEEVRPYAPRGALIPAVLRVAFDLAAVLALPSPASDPTEEISFGCALYLSLLLHRMTVPFPLFAAVQHSSDGNSGVHRSAAAGGGRCSRVEERVQQLQWVDVELAAAYTGIVLPSFFSLSSSHSSAMQLLENTMAACQAFHIPSIVWHAARWPGGEAALFPMLRQRCPERRNPLLPPLVLPKGAAADKCQLPPKKEGSEVEEEEEEEEEDEAGGTGGRRRQRTSTSWSSRHDYLSLSPDLTAIIVVLAMAKELDAIPLQARAAALLQMTSGGTSSSSASEAADRMASSLCERLDEWYEEMGFYGSSRTFYRRTQSATPSTCSSAADAFAAMLAAPASPVSDASTAAPSAPGLVDVILTDSPTANALLFIFAHVFPLFTPLELADLAMQSGLYPAASSCRSHCYQLLGTYMLRGDYSVMPLLRRLTPLTSPLLCAYAALHSHQHFPLIAALRASLQSSSVTSGAAASASSTSSHHAATRCVQNILNEFGGFSLYQFSYAIRVTDPREQNFNGYYALTAVDAIRRIAVFSCLRSGRKTLVFNGSTGRVSVCYLNEKERVLSRPLLYHSVVSTKGPVGVRVESFAAAALHSIASGQGGETGDGGDPLLADWSAVILLLGACVRLRRSMQVPMLASRREALASIRSWQQSAAMRRRRLDTGERGGGGGGGVGTPYTHSSRDLLLGEGGGGSSSSDRWQSDLLLDCLQPFDMLRSRRLLQVQFFALHPNPALIFGVSGDQILFWYATVTALVEHVDTSRKAWQQQQQQLSSSSAAVDNWLEELLFVPNRVESSSSDEEDEEVEASSILYPRAEVTPPPLTPPPVPTAAPNRTTRRAARLTMTPVMSQAKPPTGGVRLEPLLPPAFSLPPSTVSTQASTFSSAPAPPQELGKGSQRRRASSVTAQRRKRQRSSAAASSRSQRLAECRRLIPSLDVVLQGRGKQQLAAILENVGGVQPPPSDASAAVASTGSLLHRFTLFDAEECRLQLLHLLEFLGEYLLWRRALRLSIYTSSVSEVKRRDTSPASTTTAADVPTSSGRRAPRAPLTSPPLPACPAVQPSAIAPRQEPEEALAREERSDDESGESEGERGPRRKPHHKKRREEGEDGA